PREPDTTGSSPVPTTTRNRCSSSRLTLAPCGRNRSAATGSVRLSNSISGGTLNPNDSLMFTVASTLRRTLLNGRGSVDPDDYHAEARRHHGDRGRLDHHLGVPG